MTRGLFDCVAVSSQFLTAHDDWSSEGSIVRPETCTHQRHASSSAMSKASLILLLTSCAGLHACAADADASSRPRSNDPTPPRSTITAAPSTPGDFGAQPGTAGMLPAANTPSTQAPAITSPTDKAIATDECPGSVPAPVAQKLRDPAQATAGGRWLYPYDQTVFPRGLTSPILQWDGAPSGATAVYIHLKSTLLDYEICLPLTQPVRIQIPQTAWDVAGTQSRGSLDPLTVEVVVGGMASAVKLPPLTLTFALANLKGAVYYNTYGSVLATNMGIGGGVVMRVLPGTLKPPEVFLGVRGDGDQCIGCHSVSADGSRMVAEIHEGGGMLEGASHSYDLTKTSDAQPMPLPAELTTRWFLRHLSRRLALRHHRAFARWTRTGRQSSDGRGQHFGNVRARRNQAVRQQ